MSGTLYYNGFWFPEIINSKVQIRPEKDPTGRTNMWNRYSIQVEFVAYAGVDQSRNGLPDPANASVSYQAKLPEASPLDGTNGGSPSMVLLRQLLTQPRGALVFTDKGLGWDLRVGQLGIGLHQDVRYGPNPTVMAWEPIGDNRAVRIVWEVDVVVVDCPFGAPYAYNKIAWLSYEVMWGLSSDGRTSRTISGEVGVNAQVVRGVVANAADQIRERLAFPVPIRFQRKSQSYTMSPDRSRLSFNVVDEEHPSSNPLYPGIVEADVSYRVSTATGLTTSQWSASCSGTFTVAMGYPRWYAWAAFLWVVRSRMDRARNNAAALVSPGDRYESGSGELRKGAVLITSMSIEEEVFGRGMSFSMSWLFACSLSKLLDASGLWLPVPGSTWPEYRASLVKQWGPRGYADLMFQPYEDAVVGLCDARQPPSLLDPQTGQNTESPNAALLSTKCPNPAESWIKWESKCTLVEDTNTSEHYILGGSSDVKASEVRLDSDGKLNLAGSPGEAKRPIRNKITNSQWHVIYEGSAVRVGYKVPRPELLLYGGVEPMGRIGDGTFEQQLLGTVDGCRIWAAKWSIEYLLPSAPNGEGFDEKPAPTMIPGN